MTSPNPFSSSLGLKLITPSARDLGGSLIGLRLAAQGLDDLVRKGREHLASPEPCEEHQGGCSVPNSWALELCGLKPTPESTVKIPALRLGGCKALSALLRSWALPLGLTGDEDLGRRLIVGRGGIRDRRSK